MALLKAIKAAVQGTLTVSGTVTTAAAPPIVDQVSIGGSNLTVKSIAVNATSSGNNTVVAAVVSKKIRVLGFKLLAAGKVDVIWRSATAGTIINAVSLDKYIDYSFMTGIGYALENTAGEALQLNLSAAIAVRGWLIYVEV